MKQARDDTHFLFCDNRSKAWGILLECVGSSQKERGVQRNPDVYLGIWALMPLVAWRSR